MSPRAIIVNHYSACISDSPKIRQPTMKHLLLIFAFVILNHHAITVNGELPEPVSCENDHSGTTLQTCIQNTLKSLQLDVAGVLNICNSQLVQAQFTFSSHPHTCVSSQYIQMWIYSGYRSTGAGGQTASIQLSAQQSRTMHTCRVSKVGDQSGGTA